MHSKQLHPKAGHMEPRVHLRHNTDPTNEMHRCVRQLQQQATSPLSQPNKASSDQDVAWHMCSSVYVLRRHISTTGVPLGQQYIPCSALLQRWHAMPAVSRQEGGCSSTGGQGCPRHRPVVCIATFKSQGLNLNDKSKPPRPTKGLGHTPRPTKLTSSHSYTQDIHARQPAACRRQVASNLLASHVKPALLRRD